MNRFLIIFLLFISCENREEIHLEKIIFHASSCFFGKCPDYQLTIDKDYSASLYIKHIYKKDEKFPVIDSTKIGHYIGKVEPMILKSLERELYKIDIENLKLEQIIITDISQKSLIVHFNGKKIEIDATYRSKKLNGLVSILESVYEHNEFLKIE